MDLNVSDLDRHFERTIIDGTVTRFLRCDHRHTADLVDGRPHLSLRS
jgi:hypothetical protein